jgi:hypothetical protein
MTSFFTKAALATLIGLGSIATVPVAASARDVGIVVEVGHHDRHYKRPHHWRPRQACSNREAIWRAKSAGLRGAHVAGRGRNRIVVEGRRGHRFDRMVIADRRGCPIVRW